MSFIFSMRSRGLEELRDFFREFPRGVRGAAAETFADDLIGDGMRGLKHYPRYKYVTRRQAFGRPFQSDKQRRFVMSQIRSGAIQPGFPHRTGNYQRSWQRLGSGARSRIVGELPHTGWPNRLAKKVGWREPMKIIMDNLVHATRAAERAVAAWIRSKGF